MSLIYIVMKQTADYQNEIANILELGVVGDNGYFFANIVEADEYFDIQRYGMISISGLIDIKIFESRDAVWAVGDNVKLFFEKFEKSGGFTPHTFMKTPKGVVMREMDEEDSWR